MNIKATFTGQNGSLGYKTGVSYNLIVKTIDGYISIVLLETDDNAQRCDYASIESFLSNWNFITKI